MNTKEKIEVMQAYLAGKKIQIKEFGNWKDYSTGEPLWDWGSYCYRVKPEPKMLYVNEFALGSMTVWTSPEEAKKASHRAVRVAVPFKEVIAD